MAYREIKNSKKQPPQLIDTPVSLWEVMKPFVRFGLKATSMIASTLIAIVKNIPNPEKLNTSEKKNDHITKI